MIPGKPHPTPNEKIWVAAYTDDRTEYVELRTACPNGKAAYQRLWHKEQPLGMAIADFLYVDLQPLDAHIRQIGQLIDQIDRGDCVQDCFERVFEIALFWLRKTPLFAPLTAEMERLRLRYDHGEPLGTAPLQAMAERYKTLQQQLQFVSDQCFAVEDTADMTARYLELLTAHPIEMLPLKYGTLQVEGAIKGGNISLPYDDLLEFYLSGAELVLPEQFHTEVLLTETLDDLAAFLLARYARENLRYRKCKFCGRYFGVVRNYKSEYCDRLIDGSTKTCKDSGALRLYEKRKLENPAVKEYKRSYKAHNARIRYGLMTREEFQAWSKEARQNRDRCIAGELSLEEFVAWLDSDRQ